LVNDGVTLRRAAFHERPLNRANGNFIGKEKERVRERKEDDSTDRDRSETNGLINLESCSEMPARALVCARDGMK